MILLVLLTLRELPLIRVQDFWNMLMMVTFVQVKLITTNQKMGLKDGWKLI